MWCMMGVCDVWWRVPWIVGSVMVDVGKRVKISPKILCGYDKTQNLINMC